MLEVGLRTLQASGPRRPLRRGSAAIGALAATFLLASCGEPPVARSLATSPGAGMEAAPARAGSAATLPASASEDTVAAGERVEVPPPPFSPGIFPCTNCHGMMPVNPVRRELTAFHTDIVLRHDEEHRWCLDCHSAENRDSLHLANGERIPFEESYRLCGQCHGEKYRDWRAGVHGRRSGDWNGHKTYLLCAHCHNPHQPRFQPLQPLPAPIPPAATIPGRRR